ncbi:signal recognition particle 54 kD protein, putative [Ricinus communis]|uniref:Signal recognition particle 54 kD protein, putative n=1 Tax=Ricinus communis TaxID=3988 RepID=B9SBV2_RICCO|nr:signal recognition particle 54 kD protein, putative [Ricinus communis]
MLDPGKPSFCTEKNKLSVVSWFTRLRKIYNMRQICILISEKSISQAAFDQAQAFKQRVAVGAMVITKMDGHAKGGVALSAVAATNSLVIFIGTGEHMSNFQQFDAQSFVSLLSGMGDLSGFNEKVHEIVPKDQQAELLQKLLKGNFTLRTMNEQNQNMLRMGSVSQLISLLKDWTSYGVKRLSVTHGHNGFNDK